MLMLLLLLTAATPSVVCTGTGPAAGREFVLDRPAEDRPWRLSYRDRDHPQWIRLSLPGAAPQIGGEIVRLEYRNANGGRQISLDAGGERGSIDVYVDYGLDVNIDPNLDPDVDLMNTEGPLTAVACRVTTPSR